MPLHFPPGGGTAPSQPVNFVAAPGYEGVTIVFGPLPLPAPGTYPPNTLYMALPALG